MRPLLTTTTMPKIQPCTKAAKHSWDWSHNARVTTSTLHTKTLSLRGVYRCACGARKYGQPNLNTTEKP